MQVYAVFVVRMPKPRCKVFEILFVAAGRSCRRDGVLFFLVGLHRRSDEESVAELWLNHGYFRLLLTYVAELISVARVSSYIFKERFYTLLPYTSVNLSIGVDPANVKTLCNSKVLYPCI